MEANITSVMQIDSRFGLSIYLKWNGINTQTVLKQRPEIENVFNLNGNNISMNRGQFPQGRYQEGKYD